MVWNKYTSINNPYIHRKCISLLECYSHLIYSCIVAQLKRAARVLLLRLTISNKPPFSIFDKAEPTLLPIRICHFLRHNQNSWKISHNIIAHRVLESIKLWRNIELLYNMLILYTWRSIAGKLFPLWAPLIEEREIFIFCKQIFGLPLSPLLSCFNDPYWDK